MPRVYIHLVHADVKSALFKADGLSEETKVRTKLPEPVKCVRCGTVCPPDQEICQKCGLALTPEAAMKAEERSRDRDQRLENLESAVLFVVEAVSGGLRTAAEMGRDYRSLVGAPDEPPTYRSEEISGSMELFQERLKAYRATKESMRQGARRITLHPEPNWQ